MLVCIVKLIACAFIYRVGFIYHEARFYSSRVIHLSSGDKFTMVKTIPAYSLKFGVACKVSSLYLLYIRQLLTLQGRADCPYVFIAFCVFASL